MGGYRRQLGCAVPCLVIGALAAACSTPLHARPDAESKPQRTTSTTSTTMTSTIATTTTAALPGTVIASCPGGTNTPTRPTKIEIGCSGGIYSVTGITWSDWGATTAGGTGTFSQNTCQPTCGSGTSFHTSSGSVYVLDPEGGVFQEVVVTASGLRGPLTAYHSGSGWGSV